MLDKSDHRPPALDCWAKIVVAAAIVSAGYSVGRYNFLFFHCLAETFAAVVACAIFLLFWNARRFLDNGFFLLIGIACLFTGILDLMHALTFPGMSILPIASADESLQLKTAGRWIAGLSFLAAPLLLRRRINVPVALAAFAGLFALVLYGVFWGAIPVCYLSEYGATPYQHLVRAANGFAFLAAAGFLFSKRRELAPGVCCLALASWLALAASEFANAVAADFCGPLIVVAHLLEVLSLYLMYQAFVVVGIKQPYEVVFQSFKKSAQRLRLHVQQSSLAVVEFDADCRIAAWNPAAEKIFGYTAAEALEQPAALIIPLDVQPQTDKVWQRLSKGCLDAHSVNENLTKDGRTIICDWHNTPLTNAEGDFVGVVSLAEDITQRKQHENHQAMSLRRLAGINLLQEDLLLPGSIEEKLKRVTEAVVAILNLDFCRIWFIQPGDLCDRGCSHAAAEGANACRRRDQCLHLMASAGRYTRIDGSYRRVPMGAFKIGRIADGQADRLLTNRVTLDREVGDRWWAACLGLVSFAGYKLRDTNGDPIGVLAMFAKHPLSEEDDAFLSNLAETTSHVVLEHWANEELRTTREQAVEASRAKSRFLANMSHEIRTPMTAILGYAELLSDPALSPSSRNDHLAVIRRSGEHLLALINDVLDLSKIESGKLLPEMGRCSLVGLLAEVAHIMRPRCEQRRIALSVEYRSPMPETILTDSARLRQAVVNLVGNAVKFTRQGGVRIVASLVPDWHGSPPAVRIEVIDTGIGIRSEVLAQLFQPFVQGDVSISREFGGTGLGLAISRQIARLLGGDLTVTSVWGQGSTFTLTVPAGALDDVTMLDRPAEAMEQTGGRTGETPPTDLKGVRILLAEDSYDNRILIESFLRMAGGQVTSVANGRAAVDAALAQPFDVILMDINMPEMDGYQATRLLRARGYDRPILALTASAMPGDREQCRQAGCNDHLTKPIRRAHLLRAVADCLGKATAGAVDDAPPLKPLPLGDDRPIISRFAGDPDLAELLAGFVGRLQDQVQAMRQALCDSRFDDLRRDAHKLKGAGGSYGYPMLTEACKNLEEAAKVQNAGAATTALDAVADLVRAIENGYCEAATRRLPL